MSSRPSFEDLYPLLTLPRIPDLGLADKVVIPPITSIDSTIIDLGISKSIISSYIIKPTPKLIWSFALSPTSVVDCMDVINQDSTKLYVVGITERKKHKLLLIEKKEATEQVAEDVQDALEEGQSGVTSIDLKLDAKVKSVKFYNNGHSIVVLYENGNVELVKHEDHTLTKSSIKYTHTTKKSSAQRLIFSHYINDLEVNPDGSEKDLLLLVFGSKGQVIYKLISLNFNTAFLEINSSTVNTKDIAAIAYNSGYLYQLNLTTKTITSISIVNFSNVKSISVDSLIDGESEISLLAPSVDRLLLSVNNKIHLINFKFASLLDTFESFSNSMPNKVLISQAVKVPATTAKNSNSMVCFLNLKNKENNVDLNVININLGTNKLSECLNKSIEKPKESSFQGLINVIEENFETESKKSSKELHEIYTTLTDLSKANDVNKWERILIPYLKNETWSSISKSITKPIKTNQKVYQFREFDVENDRIVDIKFIKQVLLLIFKVEDDQVKFISEEFVPEFTIIYLLTNPIFPVELTNGLLKLFNDTNQITLLRQAIITCPNIQVSELLIQLVHETSNNDNQIFEDLINRLINEFSGGEITKKLKQLIEQRNKSNISAINLESLMSRLLTIKNNNNSWYFLELVIDVGGLFNWSLDTVDKLNQLVESKVNALIENSYNLTLTNQALLINQPLSKKKAKKVKKVDSDIITNNQQVQLDSILSIKNNSDRKMVDDSSMVISKKIPSYSLEKLVR